MSFCIFLIDGVQSLHQQIFVIQDLIAAVTDDDGGIAADCRERIAADKVTDDGDVD